MTNGVFQRDENHVPITQNGLLVEKTISLTANNETVAVPLFTVTGSVQFIALYGVVQETLGSQVTAASWRVNDGSAQPSISALAGTTLSGFVAGSTLVRRGIASVALVASNASLTALIDPVASTTPGSFMPFIIIEKNGGPTAIEFRYATTNTPTTGSITFYAGWVPLTPNANVTPV